MKRNVVLVVLIIILSLILVLSLVLGVGGIPKAVSPTATIFVPTSTASPTLTPDSCSSENISTQVARVHALSREFDDTSQLITSTLLQDTTVGLVQDLQRVKRSAEDQSAPSCLADLKKYQLAYMNSKIEVFGTALAFLNTYGPSSENQDALNSLLQPLQEKSSFIAIQYGNEYARLLGFTPMPTPTAALDGTPTPSP